MTAKEYLSQITRIENAIQRKRDVRASLWAQVGIPQLPDNEDRVVGSGCPKDQVSDIAIQIAEIERWLDFKIYELNNLKFTILKQIDGMENQKYGELLTCKYVLGMTWPKVAEAMHYSEDYCKKELHSRALQMFYRMYLKPH